MSAAIRAFPPALLPSQHTALAAHLLDVTQEGVSEPLAARSALHQTCDVHDLQKSRYFALRLEVVLCASIEKAREKEMSERARPTSSVKRVCLSPSPAGPGSQAAR